MEERNSEGKRTFWAIVGIVAAGLVVVGERLLGAGLLSDWPTAVTIIGVVVSVAKLVGDYTTSRPAKHAAMNEAKALGLTDKGGAEDPTSAPSP